MRDASTFSVQSPSTFRASITRLRLDHVALEVLAAAPHRSESGLLHIPEDRAAAFRTISLLEGRCSVKVADVSFTLHAGEFVVLESRDTISYTATTDVRMLVTMIGIEHVPMHLRRRGMTISSPLRSTPLVNSFVAFATTILRNAAVEDVPCGFLVRAIADLQSLILAEAQQGTSRDVGIERLRRRAEEYIEAHLADPSLGPAMVAGALAISVRHLYNVFTEPTVGRYIRERRLQSLALDLRSAGARLSLQELAERHGFASKESMSRAFRERFDVAPRTYGARSRRSFE